VTGLTIRQHRHGISDDQFVPVEFFDSPEYRTLSDLAERLDGLLETGAYVTRGNKRRDVSSFGEALQWLMEEAKRGQNIQRYKGLGEMNPEQLWETTMNPDSRRLLQVTIEDAVAADEVFTTLMGDQVEPRRDFIEKNALYVENLDV
jgi:DNA gyrase subunit B